MSVFGFQLTYYVGGQKRADPVFRSIKAAQARMDDLKSAHCGQLTRALGSGNVRTAARTICSIRVRSGTAARL